MPHPGHRDIRFLANDIGGTANGMDQPGKPAALPLGVASPPAARSFARDLTLSGVRFGPRRRTRLATNSLE